METLKEKTARGLFWGGINNGFQQLLGFAFGIILGRLLSPTDYGMIAMITIFSLVATALQDSGFRAAIVNLKEATDNDYNSVFWFNIIVGISLYVILFFSAPFIADYYHTPALVPLCRYAFLGFVISSFGTAQAAFLTRNLMVKQQAKCGMTAVIVSNVTGVTFAWFGYGYWSVATQGIAFISINTIMMWHYSSWRPSLKIDFRPVCRMFRFSCKLLITTIISHVNNNVLNILLGRYFTAHEVGNYNQAYQWDSKAYYLVQGMLNMVAQPVFSSLTDERERQLRALRKMVRFTAFISFPLMFGLAIVSRELIVITITAKWLVSARILQVLCLSGAFIPLSTILSNLIISHGRSNIYMWCTLLLGATQIVVMMLLYRYGIFTMVIAYVILNILWFFVWQFFVHRLIGYNFLMLFRDILPYVISALAVMAVTYYVTMSIHSLVILFISRIILAVVAYYLVMKISKSEILDECMSFLKSKVK
jgi:O-antigen/teichoic acid export membrane protein